MSRDGFVFWMNFVVQELLHINSFNFFKMAKKEIKTAIKISATPEMIWKVLTDFEQYPDWNKFLSSVEGNFKVGNQVKIIAGGMKFKPKVLVFEEKKEIRWLGKLLVSGLFDGEHIFRIIDHRDGTCTFQQEENFSGILVGLFAKQLDEDTKNGFIQMNEKLKELCEKQ